MQLSCNIISLYFRPDMNTYSHLAPTSLSSLIYPRKCSCLLHFPKIYTQTLVFSSPFCRTPKSSQFRFFYKFPRPFSPVEDEEEEEEDDDDEEEVADEYEDITDEVANSVVDVSDSEDDETDVTLEKSRYEEFKWQRIERLCNDVKLYGEQIIDVSELSSIYNFRIDKFQRLSIEAFLRGSSVVVSAPTSSGKTLIAEAAAVATVARGRRLFYTTPLKALSNQKFREFREAFGESNVGLLTGDSAVNKDAQVLIMTTEILRNMLYQSVGSVPSQGGLFHVDVIVLDEVHYLSDISRGTVWEEIVIYCPKEVQLICLSATVANPDELAGWISQIHGKTELVTSSKRPVPLMWHFSTKTSLVPLLNEKGTSMNSVPREQEAFTQVFTTYLSGPKSYEEEVLRRRRSRRRDSDISPLSKNDISNIRRSQVPQVRDTLWHLETRDMLPAIWFIFSRKGCDAAVQYLEESKLLDEREAGEVESALKKFRIQYPDAVRESAVKGLKRGVAAHHAGCLPLWKSFVEELFQRGLVKVVFATETLAAGINMPARTAVIASLCKRTESGRIQLRTNELLQMAGRAGRRGIDKQGHTVLVQSPYEGAEECCKILFGGLEPLVSQFTASYGMVLNLLAGAKATRRSSGSGDMKISEAGRTLEEARKLVEQSFGNYVGSNVMQAAKEELIKIKREIELLSSDTSDEAIDRKSRKALSETAYMEIKDLQAELRAEKSVRTELRKKVEFARISALKPVLKDLENGHLPFVCLQYNDNKGVQHLVPAVYLGMVDSLIGSKVKNMVDVKDSFTVTDDYFDNAKREHDVRPCYYVALGSDNSWYLFTEKFIKTIYKTGFPNVGLAEGDSLPRQTMIALLDREELPWQKLVESELGCFWCSEGALETWSWSLNVPVLSTLSEDDEVVEFSQAYHDAVENYKDQRNKVARLKKKLSRTVGFKEYKKIVDMTNFTEEKIRRLKLRSDRLTSRIEQIEPSGWKEFLQVSSVIHEARALDTNEHIIYPLGETAAAIRGENELWLAMVLRNKVLVDLKPAQLAAVCGSLVSDGIKVRPTKDNNYIYEPSNIVMEVINILSEQKNILLGLQEKHGVTIPCCLDSQFSGMVEAWASGLTWKEIMMDCVMDEGDVARLLRRTIDILAQVPKLRDISASLQSNAIKASSVMDRPPMSELTG